MIPIRDRCPLCGDKCLVEHSVALPNLYSEKLASLTGQMEELLLEQHSNWQCLSCGLIFKRRWFDESVIRDLFRREVQSHPKGWDAVLNRFTPANFERTLDRWTIACEQSIEPDIRRGERELLSILDSIAEPEAFDHAAAVAAIHNRDVKGLRRASSGVIASIGEPIAFKRFTAFRSHNLWNYLQDKVGRFDAYAEIGCPLWGLLGIAADYGVDATFLDRPEINYWGPGCVNNGVRCTTRLLQDPRISNARWDEGGRYSVIGAFQYLDHAAEPRRLLDAIFTRTDSLALILDSVKEPVAIQHVTGWTDSALAFVADSFGKTLHSDFEEIKPSGNELYLLAGPSR